MAKPSFLLVVPAEAEAEFAEYVRESVAPIFQSDVKILTDSQASLCNSNVPENVSRQLFESIRVHDFYKDRLLLVHRETKCSQRLLAKMWTSEGYVPSNLKIFSPERIRKELKNRWEAAGILWRTYAEKQISSFDFQKIGLDAWLQQFGELGYPRIGRRLASQLRVIRLNELAGDPFGLRPSEQIGQSQAYCYVQDEDPGGSWAEIQSILSHTHNPGSVHPVRWRKSTAEIVFPNADVDEFVLCEDGLWSGSETILRLQAIKEIDVKKPSG